MNPLETLIRGEIAREGVMSLARYMALCLGHPDHGYYMTRDPFGADGDFTTAPEISQMFGEMIGAWLAHQWLERGKPAPFALVEAGPGRGTLMADILRATRGVPGFHEAARIHLLEMSPVLRKAQEKTLSGYEVTWHEELESLPSDLPLVFVANEFLDALPVHQLVWGGEWQERMVVSRENDTIGFETKKTDEALIAVIPESLLSPEVGDMLEISLVVNSFVKELAHRLEKQQGFGIFIDYGYARSAYGDTVQALYQHQPVSIFDRIGEADITAHVNFETVSSYLPNTQLTTQGAFLTALGIEARAQALLAHANDKQKTNILSGLQRLTAPEQMGRLFKVLTFGA